MSFYLRTEMDDLDALSNLMKAKPPFTVTTPGNPPEPFDNLFAAHASATSMSRWGFPCVMCDSTNRLIKKYIPWELKK